MRLVPRGGLQGDIFVFLPKTPWWLARRGKIDQARKVLDRTYKGVPGNDSDRQMGIILASIEQQRKRNAETDALGPFAMLKGLNLKQFLIGSYPKALSRKSDHDLFDAELTSCRIRWSCGFQQPSHLLLPDCFYRFQPFHGELRRSIKTFPRHADKQWATIITSSVGLAATILDAILVDTIGRRRMTVIGYFSAAFGLTLIAIMDMGCLPFRTNSGMAPTMIVGGATASFFDTFETSIGDAFLPSCPS